MFILSLALSLIAATDPPPPRFAYSDRCGTLPGIRSMETDRDFYLLAIQYSGSQIHGALERYRDALNDQTKALDAYLAAGGTAYPSERFPLTDQNFSLTYRRGRVLSEINRAIAFTGLPFGMFAHEEHKWVEHADAYLQKLDDVRTALSDPKSEELLFLTALDESIEALSGPHADTARAAITSLLIQAGQSAPKILVDPQARTEIPSSELQRWCRQVRSKGIVWNRTRMVFLSTSGSDLLTYN